MRERAVLVRSRSSSGGHESAVYGGKRALGVAVKLGSCFVIFRAKTASIVYHTGITLI